MCTLGWALRHAWRPNPAVWRHTLMEVSCSLMLSMLHGDFTCTMEFTCTMKRALPVPPSLAPVYVWLHADIHLHFRWYFCCCQYLAARLSFASDVLVLSPHGLLSNRVHLRSFCGRRTRVFPLRQFLMEEPAVW